MTGENAARLSAVAYAQHQPPRKPPSPQVHQQPSPLTQFSPSTVKESPQQTPRPFDARSSVEPTAKKEKGMRSQIACVRCRKSKTKCENTGQGTVCKACANTGRECQWEHAAVASSTGSLRRDSTADDVSHVKHIPTFVAIPHCGCLIVRGSMILFTWMSTIKHVQSRSTPSALQYYQRSKLLMRMSTGPAQEAPQDSTSSAHIKRESSYSRGPRNIRKCP
jgi:hypothetical protein